MKTIILTILTLGFTTFMSCGPSEESIRRETKLKMEIKMALQDSILSVKNQKLRFENALSDAKAELEVAKDQFSRIKEFKLGRLTSERNEQIRSQTKVIEEIENLIEKYKEYIPILDQNIKSYEIQLQNVEAELNK